MQCAVLHEVVRELLSLKVKSQILCFALRLIFGLSRFQVFKPSDTFNVFWFLADWCYIIIFNNSAIAYCNVL